MNKPTCVIYAPISSYSGYGSASRDKCKSLIELYSKEWDIKIISCGWGNLPMSFIEDHIEDWGFLNDYILQSQLTYQPDIMIWITVPHEVKPIGKWNCLFTAGIETDICSPQWVEALNTLDLIIVPSEHSKSVFVNTSYSKQDQNTKQVVGEIKNTKPVEVLFEGFNENIYKSISSQDNNSRINKKLNNIKEDFCFLGVGMWLPGIYNEDRKNITGLIKVFLETFKNKKKKPALVLKTSKGSASLMDKEKILKDIQKIKETVNSKNLPNIYVIHGDLSDTEMNELYNHNKIKAMVSLTKGEGFGRPLLEFTQSKKPIICSGWGGQIDFLPPSKTTLLPGSLTPVHQSAFMENMIVEGSKWFSVDLEFTSKILNDYFENYPKYENDGKRLAYHCKENFTYEKMKEKMKKIMDDNVKLPYQLKLPKLTKIE